MVELRERVLYAIEIDGHPAFGTINRWTAEQMRLQMIDEWPTAERRAQCERDYKIVEYVPRETEGS
jgi:hypothetical protein